MTPLNLVTEMDIFRDVPDACSIAACTANKKPRYRISSDIVVSKYLLLISRYQQLSLAAKIQVLNLIRGEGLNLFGRKGLHLAGC